MVKTRRSRLLGKRWSPLKLVLSMLTVVIFMFLALGISSLLSSDDSSSNDLISHRRMVVEKNEGLRRTEEKWTEVLSWEPRAFLYHNFLSKEECEHLISFAKPRVKQSLVVDAKTGGSIESRVRTSSGMFANRGEDKIIRDIEQRIADFTFIPAEHGEGLQILHYEDGQKYEPHYDYFLDKFNTKNGGQRIATMLMYLSDVEEGGSFCKTKNGKCRAVLEHEA